MLLLVALYCQNVGGSPADAAPPNDLVVEVCHDHRTQQTTDTRCIGELTTRHGRTFADALQGIHIPARQPESLMQNRQSMWQRARLLELSRLLYTRPAWSLDLGAHGYRRVRLSGLNLYLSLAAVSPVVRVVTGPTAIQSSCGTVVAG